jgi:TetR/AcrR family transcriptional regulator, transcriptional repressor for nem operon
MLAQASLTTPVIPVSENLFLTIHSNMCYTPAQGETQDDSMAGKKAFDPQRVLEKAMNAFWERGYEGISIEDLVQSTGIGRGSLYDTFADKHSLYLAALDQYIAAVRAQTTALLDQPGTLQELLRRLFQTQVDALLSDPARRGCFLVNASLEMAPHDPKVSTIVQSALQELEEGLYRLLIKAQVAGELPLRHDPHQLAHFLVATLVGIRVLARNQQDRRVLEDVVKTAVSVFD